MHVKSIMSIVNANEIGILSSNTQISQEIDEPA